MMRYLQVRWNHQEEDEPVLLLSELDQENWEIRKVEVFRDGSTGFADVDHETESTFLSEKPLPSIEDIAADPQFFPEWIEQSEFEHLWESVHRVPHLT